MIKCTAPIRGHRSPRAERDCPRCGNRPAKTSRNSESQYSHAERVKQLSKTPKLPFTPEQCSDIRRILNETTTKRTHIPLTIARTQWAAGPGFFHTGTIRSKGMQFTYVYDCGTARSLDLLQKEIDTYLESIRCPWTYTPHTASEFYLYGNTPYFDLSRNHYLRTIHKSLYKRNYSFSGTPFTTEWDDAPEQTTQPSHIDIVFISHFDTDHINGLAYLIQNTIVKILAIPFTTPRERFLHLCKSTFANNASMNRARSGEYYDYILEFTASPAGAIRRFPEFLNREASNITLIEIQHERDNEGHGRHDFTHPVYTPANSSGDNKNKKHEAIPVWLFSASTLQGNADELGAELIDSLIKQGIIDSESDLENATTLQYIFDRKDISSKIADTYRSIAHKNLNATSLILHSGPAHPENSPAFHHMFWRGDQTHKFHSILEVHSPWATGWLGCGDANLKKVTNVNLFDQLFWKQKLFSSTFAPPHHGSQHDWNQHLLDAFGYPSESAPVCVFSADGLYKHPSPNVIADANSRGSTTYVVTTDPKSRLTETLAILVPTDKIRFY